MTKMDNLLKALRKEASTIREAKDVIVPTQIPVTHGVLSKVHTLCDLVFEEGKNHYEWYFRLLASKADPTFTVRDIHVPKGVLATEGHVDLPGSDAGIAYDEIKLYNQRHGTDWMVVGYGHSHAGFNSVRHSSTDDDNHANLASVLWANTQYREWIPLHLIGGDLARNLEEGRIIVQGRAPRDGRVTLDLPAEKALQALLEKHALSGEVDREDFVQELIGAMPIEVYEPLLKGFCYSIVVNDAHVEPYARIAQVEQRGITNKPDEKRFSYTETKVHRVEVREDVTIDRDELRALVKERIVFPSAARKATSILVSTASTALEELRDLGEILVLRGTEFSHPEAEREASELAANFGYRTGEYLVRFRSPDVRYAGYVDGLMQGLFVKESGLMATIQQIGPLQPDGGEINRPKFHPTWIPEIHGTILRNLSRNSGLELAFMRAYCSGNPKKSIERALQTYVPRFLAVRDGQS